jgi:hypothetical protein
MPKRSSVGSGSVSGAKFGRLWACKNRKRITIMKVQLLCNYGNLEDRRVYEVQESGRDWDRINGVFVPSLLTVPISSDPDQIEDWPETIPIDGYESYAQYIDRELPPVACW